MALAIRGSQDTNFNYKVVSQFAIVTVLWGIVGMLVGVVLAAQLIWPEITMNIPWLSYGRLRPLHTNAVIFAFGGSALFATSYYIVQRTCQVRLFSDKLAAFTFWGWQLVIVAAAITLPLGITTSKEYAELEWPIDILITIVWVAYAIVFFGTIMKRKTKHIYVSNWFFGAYILTIAILHIVNNIEMPASLWKSYSAYSGAQDVGMVFSLILLAPSWGGMINGIMTLSGAWYKLRSDPILKFLIVALSFYGMSTFEGSMMSIKTVNGLSHYTDWTIGHVHSGALGWVAMITIGSLYYLIPRLVGKKEMYSTRLIELHFWIATIGVVLYIAAMWIAGVMQGLMWRAFEADGTLTYSFVESVKASYPFYVIRLLGGICYLGGMFLMAYNVFKTLYGERFVDARIPTNLQVAH
ncbi:MAG: cbb3-type cytochrome c oxidase subunit I [Burkholderiaceae bacterium]|nr:cbb3-type cytochrome c oxidase subunit I [Burkholderiaceae bacterium]